MKKILMVVNGISPSTHVISFAIKSAKEGSYILQGIFLNSSTEPAGFQYPFPNDMPLTEVQVTMESIEEENKSLLNSNIQLFKDECQAAGITYEVSTDFSLKELIEQSSIAELIILDANADYPHFPIKDVLTGANCPVLHVGTQAPMIERVLLTYDGSEASKYAIDKYKDAFPFFHHLPTFLVSINLSPLEILEHKEYVNQWLPKQFPNLTKQRLEGDVKDELMHFLKLHSNNTLVVMGAFGRDVVSRFFHPSLANAVLAETRISLFIAHK